MKEISEGEEWMKLPYWKLVLATLDIGNIFQDSKIGKRLNRDRPTGLATNHFLFSHGERREFFRPRNTQKTRKWGIGNGKQGALPVSNFSMSSCFGFFDAEN